MIKNELLDTNLKTKDFYYNLPQKLIAQEPVSPRDSAKLMVLDKENGIITHKRFYDIIDYLSPGDVLVINDSKVIPARIYGRKKGSNGHVELLLLKQLDSNRWEVIAKPGKRLKPNTEIEISEQLNAIVISDLDDGKKIIKFNYEGDNFFSILDNVGIMPLPPYITKKLVNKDDYQTVYANIRGSAAAPTAGLHFTNELLNKIEQKGVVIAKVMLHVGLGTFRPVKTDNISDHIMHSEYFSVSQESADLINNRKGRLFAVGTTSCRVIESASDDSGFIHPMTDSTSIFIYPGYKFKITDALITNFHLPESTLLMLISALASKDKIMNAYDEAIKNNYRFFSFGDAMLII